MATTLTDEEKLALKHEYENAQLERAQEFVALTHKLKGGSRGEHNSLLRLLKETNTSLKYREERLIDDDMYSVLTTARDAVVARLTTLVERT